LNIVEIGRLTTAKVFASWKLHPVELRMKIEIKFDDWYLDHSCLSCLSICTEELEFRLILQPVNLEILNPPAKKGCFSYPK
jgi:hypothetical protein